MTWSELGSVSITASDLYVDLGPVVMGIDDDTIWLHVTQTSPTENWKYSFGIASFISSEGAELGSTKVYGNQLGEVYALGVRRPPLDRTGFIRFRPRHYNLQWVALDASPNWSLDFQWESGQSGSGVLSLGTRSTLGVLADPPNADLDYTFRDKVARVRLTY